MAAKTIFSFVVDSHPKYAYNGFHLARPLVQHCGGNPGDVHVQMLPEVSIRTRRLFADAGYQVHEMQRFGDLRHCNKASQLESLCGFDFDRVILLDTDMIAVADVCPMASPAGKFGGKVVDYPNPSIGALEDIARNAGLSVLPRIVSADAENGMTYERNCNGGFYSIPKAYVQTVSQEWKRWILWLLEHIEPLRREGKQIHGIRSRCGSRFNPIPSLSNRFPPTSTTTFTWRAGTLL